MSSTLVAPVRALYHVSLSYPLMLLLGVLGLVFVFWWLAGKYRGATVDAGPAVRAMARLGAVMGLLLFAAELALYYARGSLLDHAEPQIACVAALALRGEPVYHPAETPLAYAVVYGPLLYLIHGAFLLIGGASLATTKSVGVFALVCAVGFFVMWARREARSHSWLWARWPGHLGFGFLAIFLLVKGGSVAAAAELPRAVELPILPAGLPRVAAWT